MLTGIREFFLTLFVNSLYIKDVNTLAFAGNISPRLFAF